MKRIAETNACCFSPADSDSANLGSNPSPPASGYADVYCITRPQGPSEQSELREQTAHVGRTKAGTTVSSPIAEKVDLNNDTQGFVYFITCDHPDFPIKIEFATDIKARLRSLQTSLPYKVRLIASVAGTLQSSGATRIYSNTSWPLLSMTVT